MLTNQLFCYWLQGYFEITPNPLLSADKIKKIEAAINMISEPLGDYTGWLKTALQAIAANDYRAEIINHMTPHIKKELNLIFFHVIDNSYDTEHSHEFLKSVHDGKVDKG